MISQVHPLHKVGRKICYFGLFRESKIANKSDNCFSWENKMSQPSGKVLNKWPLRCFHAELKPTEQEYWSIRRSKSAQAKWCELDHPCILTIAVCLGGRAGNVTLSQCRVSPRILEVTSPKWPKQYWRGRKSTTQTKPTSLISASNKPTQLHTYPATYIHNVYTTVCEKMLGRKGEAPIKKKKKNVFGASHGKNTNLPIYQYSKHLNPCHAEQIKMPHPLLIFSQSEYLIHVVDTNSHAEWQCRSRSVGFSEANWSDLHCLKRQGTSGFSRTRFQTRFLQKKT